MVSTEDEIRMKRIRLAWMMLAIAVMLLAGCARSPGRDEGTQAVDPMEQAITSADQAVRVLNEAAQMGDLAAVRAAYERFSAAFGKVLGPVSLQDPRVAEKMANANSALKEMMTGGQVDAGAVAREVAVIQLGLQEAVAVMARAEELPVSADPDRRTIVNGQGVSGQQVRGAMERTIDATAVDYKLNPAEIRVKRGTKVTIRFANKGTERHEFEIEEYDFEIGPIEPGQVVSKSFVADRAGRFAYECHVDGHLQRGMKGTLVVEE